MAGCQYPDGQVSPPREANDSAHVAGPGDTHHDGRPVRHGQIVSRAFLGITLVSRQENEPPDFLAQVPELAIGHAGSAGGK